MNRAASTRPARGRSTPADLRLPVAALVAAAFLFGITFVVVKSAVAGFPPLAFVGWRFSIGAVALMALALPRSRQLWRDGAVAGVWLFAGFAFQTVGLRYTDAGNSALITGLYVVLTPLFSALWRRRAPSPWVIIGTVVAFIGLALLTIDDRVVLGTGDLLTLACAAGFAGHIVFLSQSAPRHPVIPFTAAQLAVTALLGLTASAVIERPTLPDGAVWPSLLLTGLGVSAIAFLLQVWAQTRLGASRTAVILTSEPVFGVAAAAILLGERLTIGGWVGAVLILLAIQLVLSKASSADTTEAESVSSAH